MQDDESAVSHTRLAYLPALDGMRACAVLAVMMFHGGIPHMDGGFMGVDAFFVLSGFLITSLLIGEWRQALTIKLGAFWARRARRLLPALLLMLLFVAFFAAVIVPKGTYGALRLDALATLLYVSNWHFILVNSNYFNETSASSPLLHTWSLAVEEQFYVVWPLVVLGVLHFTRSLRALFALCCAAAVASAIWMYHVYDGGLNTNRAYLGTDTRSQCLFIGCALAVGLVLLTQHRHEEGRLAKGELWRPESSTGLLLCGVLGVVGAVGAVALWVLTTSTSTFPYSGGFFLIGLSVASVILAAVAAPHSIVPRLLSVAPIRYVGRISYGLYIWHWPIFIWLDHSPDRALRLRALRVTRAGDLRRLGRVLPSRRAADPDGHVRQPVAGVAGGARRRRRSGGGHGGGHDGDERRRQHSAAADAHGSTSTTTSTTAPATSVAGPPVKVLLFGDSVALTLGLGLGEQSTQDKYDYQLTDRGILGCGVVDGPQVELMGTRYDTPLACGGSGVTPGGAAVNEPWPDQWRDAITQDKPNVVVLLAGRWEVVDRQYNGKWTNILNPTYAAYVKSQLEQASQLVTATGAHMVFLTAPCTDEGEQPDGDAWPEDSPARLAVYNKLVREVAAEHPTTDSAVDLFGAACPGKKFATKVGGVTIRDTDGVHFTAAGGVYVAPKIMPAIVAAGRAQMAGSATTTSAGG